MGNIWVVSCASDSITQFPNCNPDLASEIAPVDDSSDPLVQSPFGLTIGPMGQA
jgi:hypothetical protein